MQNTLPRLNTLRLGRSFVFLDEVDSTNNYCKEHAVSLPHGTAVMAAHQYAGKGRVGRAWQHDKEAALAFSLLLNEGVRLEDMPRLPLLAGVAVCLGLQDLCGKAFTLKWSNDVLYGSEKICGILCESRITPSAPNPFAVVGMGVNLTQQREDFARLDLVYATSLYIATGKKYAAGEAATAILNAMEPLWDRFCATGFSAILDQYKSLCVTLGREVRVLRGNRETLAVAEDIGPDGSLICKLPDGGRFPVNAGEASVRGLLGYI